LGLELPNHSLLAQINLALPLAFPSAPSFESEIGVARIALRQRTTPSRLANTILILGCVMMWPLVAGVAGDGPAPQRLAQLPAPSDPPQPSPPAAAAAATTPQAIDRTIGSVAAVEGRATVTRNEATTPLKRNDTIFMADVLQTGSNGTLGVTFNDDTTFMLTQNSRITVDNFVYQEGGAGNAAVFNVVHGTLVFVASKVAKTGNMRVETPSATLGLRGTTGIVEVPESGNAAGQVVAKLYSDADGGVGRVEVSGRDGVPLGILSRDATGFAVRPQPPGAAQQFSAVPLQISAQEAERDRALVRRTLAAQLIGRQINQRRSLQRFNQLAPNPVPPPPLERQLVLRPPPSSAGPTAQVPACEVKNVNIPWGGSGSAAMTVSGGKSCSIGWHDTGATILDSMSVSSPPSHGSLSPQDQHVIIFTPAPGYTGQDSFTLSMREHNGARRATMSVKVSVTIK
jgi:FecR-like protein/Big-like domain-containing protein